MINILVYMNNADSDARLRRSNAKLSPNAIYVILFARGFGGFHWSLAIGGSDESATKLHASNMEGPWVFKSEWWTVVDDPLCCVIYKIGRFFKYSLIFLFAIYTSPTPVPSPQSSSLSPNFLESIPIKVC